MSDHSLTNTLVSRLRDAYVQQSARCGEEDSQERSLLAQEAADEIERLQAKIDALMLEHCPDEMTPEQRTEWAKHQRPSAEPSGCPEHGMEHFFEGMCIKCGVVPAVRTNEQSS